jgi:hypothetical protein
MPSIRTPRPARKAAATKAPAAAPAPATAAKAAPSEQAPKATPKPAPKAATAGKAAPAARPPKVTEGRKAGDATRADKADRTDKPAKAAKVDKAAKPRHKPVRDSFTMPVADFALIAALKARMLAQGQVAKKSELLRAGLHALSGLDDAALKAALGRLAPVKIGRPRKGH